MPVRWLSPTLSPTIYLAPARHLSSFRCTHLRYPSRRLRLLPSIKRPSIPQPPYRRTGLHLHCLHLCSTHPRVCDGLDLAHRPFISMITGRIPRLLAFGLSLISHITRFLVLLPNSHHFLTAFYLFLFPFFSLSTQRHPLASFCPIPPRGQDYFSLSVAFFLRPTFLLPSVLLSLVARPPLALFFQRTPPLEPGSTSHTNHFEIDDRLTLMTRMLRPWQERGGWASSSGLFVRG